MQKTHSVFYNSTYLSGVGRMERKLSREREVNTGSNKPKQHFKSEDAQPPERQERGKRPVTGARGGAVPGTLRAALARNLQAEHKQELSPRNLRAAVRSPRAPLSVDPGTGSREDR